MAASGDPTYIVLPEGMTGWKLRKVADWIDIFEKISTDYFRVLYNNHLIKDPQLLKILDILDGKEVQEDLRKWADHLDGVKV